MVSTLTELEMQLIDTMSREQLLAAIRQRLNSLPPDLLMQLEDQPTDALRLYLLAARLIGALRQMQNRDQFAGRERFPAI
jgi:hypothetical protein